MTSRLVRVAAALSGAKPPAAAMLSAARDVVELVRTEGSEIVEAVRNVPPSALLARLPRGSALGVAALTALPLFGPVGALTAAGVAVGATIGALASVAEEVVAAKRRSTLKADDKDDL